MNLETLGLFGVFLAGAIPWMEAVAVVPAGILLGLDPIATVIAAAFGNSLTIFAFAYLGANLRSRLVARRVAKGKSAESPKFDKALKAFDRWGVYGMAILGPVLIGTQFAAAASVAAGVKPLRAASLVTAGMLLWAVLVAMLFVSTGLTYK